jgi:hypothetical protein
MAHANKGYADADNIVYRALGHQVLAVAVYRQEGSWSCYVDAVRGIAHETESYTVAHHGDKQLERIARAIFPEIRLPYAP